MILRARRVLERRSALFESRPSLRRAWHWTELRVITFRSPPKRQTWNTRTATYRMASAGAIAYGYDANGNRTLHSGHTVGAFDNQDRLASYGSAAFTYSASQLQNSFGNREAIPEQGRIGVVTVSNWPAIMENATNPLPCLRLWTKHGL